jgi:hypothetical protein
LQIVKREKQPHAKTGKIRKNKVYLVLHAAIEYLPAACKRVAGCLWAIAKG